MSIYHCRIGLVSRGKGQSLTAKVSYMSGQKLTDEYTGEVKFYKDTDSRVLYSGIVGIGEATQEKLQEHLKAWDKSEARKDAQTAFTYEVALPNEWDLETCRKAIEEYLPAGSVYSIHWNENNHHFHAVEPQKEYDLESASFAKKKKVRISKRDFGEKWTKPRRKEWAEVANKYLTAENQISEKSLKDQGETREPTIHEGYAAREIEKRGEVSERAEYNRQVQRDAQKAAASIRLIEDEENYLTEQIRKAERLIKEAREKAAELLKPFRGIFKKWNSLGWDGEAVFETDTGEKSVEVLDAPGIYGMLTPGQEYSIRSAEKDDEVIAEHIENDTFNFDYDSDSHQWSTALKHQQHRPMEIEERQHSRGYERTR